MNSPAREAPRASAAHACKGITTRSETKASRTRARGAPVQKFDGGRPPVQARSRTGTARGRRANQRELSRKLTGK